MSPKLRPVVGWREWVGLPGLGIPAIKAKVDTGARTSAIHAVDLRILRRGDRRRAHFLVHPLQRRTDVVVACVGDVIDRRAVTDSGGHREERWVVRTMVRVHGLEWPIEITLTDRDTMRFRMLLGRNALAHHLLVDPATSYLAGRIGGKVYRRKRS